MTTKRSAIPHQETELRQWFFASRIGTEEAWKSVIDYPGVSELTKLRAKQQLASDLSPRTGVRQSPGSL